MHWWFPGKGLSIGDDQLGNCGPQAYARFGLPYHQRLLDHFGGGWYHLHSKDLCLVPEIAQLKGLDCLEISDDPNTPKRGFSSIDDIRQHLPETPLRICCGPDELLNGLRDGTLPGNVVYYVSGKDYSDIDCWSIDDANEIMDMVRAYKTGRRES